MKVSRLLFLLSFLFVTGLDCIHAQQVYAQVSSRQVRVGETFDYSVVANVNVNDIQIPQTAGIALAGGPYNSKSVQVVNGVMTTQLSVTWQMVAQKEGKITLGRAVVTIGNQKVETNPIVIEVSKNGSAGNEPGGGGSDLFIRTNVSKTKCYVGEQITITQKVYSRLQIISFRNFPQPSYDGFYSIAQESASKGQLAIENIDGVNYYTYELFRSQGIANKPGKIQLTPIEGEVIVRKVGKPRSIIEQMFGGAAVEDFAVNVKSRSLSVEVIDLPKDGQPENFNGAVGNFNYKATVSKNELKANEAFNLKLTVSGNGNIKLLAAPKLTLPESFESYEPKVTESGNSKTFEYPVVPRKEGNFTLNDLDFYYFNLDSKKYVKIPADPISIHVLPPDPNAAGAAVYNPHTDVKETENDIRYIKRGELHLVTADKEFFNSGLHMTLLVLPFVLLGGGLFARRSYIRSNSDVVAVRERKAGRMARGKMQKAEKLKNEGKKEDFYTEILSALYDYIGHKLNINSADISREKITAGLTQRSVNPVTMEKLFKTLDAGEYAKYAPGAVSGDLATVYEETVKLITDLEEQLNRRV